MKRRVLAVGITLVLSLGLALILAGVLQSEGGGGASGAGGVGASVMAGSGGASSNAADGVPGLGDSADSGDAFGADGADGGGADGAGSVAGRANSDGARGLPPTAVPQCPVRLVSLAPEVRYKRTATVENWQVASGETCEELARVVLLDLRDQGTRLVTAGYLDLNSEAWGCTVACTDGSAIVVTLVPQALGRVRGDENRLNVSVVLLRPPEL